MQVIRAIEPTIRGLEVIVAVPVEGATEALSVSIVHAGCPDRQAHPPITNISPNKGPGRKDQLQEESHIQQLVNIVSSCIKNSTYMTDLNEGQIILA